MRLALVSVIAGLVLAGTLSFSTASAAEPATMVLEWNQHALAAIYNPPTASPVGAGQTPPVGALHLAMVQAAVYDAVNAIDRGHEPYLRGLPRAPRSASKPAAVATAAHHVLVGLVPALPDAVKANLDSAYTASLATIANGSRKTAGVNIGAAVAKAMLAKRVNDGRYVPFQFTVDDDPGDWRPTPPAFINDPFAWVSNVKPFAIGRASRFRTAGPHDLDSAAYAREFNEVKTKGSLTGSTRTAKQNELVAFFATSPIPMIQAGYRDVVKRKGLSITKAARLFGMVSVSLADSFIACWDDKDRWKFWRPITAIQNAGSDGNDATAPQADWQSFIPSPPYPEHPSGFNCGTAAMIQAGRAFFGTNHVRIKLTSPVTSTTRTYSRLSGIVTDAINVRVWQGIHFRTADVQAAQLGRRVGAYVANHYFEPVD